MHIDRKTFLRLSGVSFVVLAGRKLGSAAQSRLTAKRWAMAIDINKCARDAGCTKCLDACHQIHNVPNFPGRQHEVKWIWREPFEHIFPASDEQTPEGLRHATLPVLCNHCDEPPCVRVCPTQATWKRDDGLVMMDWHRCIGCRYCVAACPYGSRSFNWLDPRPQIEHLNPDFPTRAKGVVEKCNFCEERLAKGRLPACVEACDEKAIAFGDIEDPKSPVRQLLGSRFSLRRKPELGTGPKVYYVV